MNRGKKETGNLSSHLPDIRRAFQAFPGIGSACVFCGSRAAASSPDRRSSQRGTHYSLSTSYPTSGYDTQTCYIPTTARVSNIFLLLLRCELLYFNFLSTFPDISCLPCNTCGFFYIFVLHLHKTGRHGYLLLNTTQ